MQEQLIDVEQIEFYCEEIRRDPLNTDERLEELIKLYRVQQRLIEQGE